MNIWTRFYVWVTYNVRDLISESARNPPPNLTQKHLPHSSEMSPTLRHSSSLSIHSPPPDERREFPLYGWPYIPILQISKLQLREATYLIRAGTKERQVLIVCFVWPGGTWDLSSPIRARTCVPCITSQILTSGPPGKPSKMLHTLTLVSHYLEIEKIIQHDGKALSLKITPQQ